jgi:hypothetical protein
VSVRIYGALLGVALIFAAPIAGLAQQPGNCGYYKNRSGQLVQRPCGDARTESPPPGATAVCRDGSYSFSRHRRGTCSRHGGVAHYR